MLKPDGFHHLKLTLSSSDIKADWSCTASEGAICRMQCPSGCESWPCDHQLTDSGECWMLDWLNNASIEENYAGEPFVLYDGLFKGNWNGDCVEIELEIPAE